MAQTNYTPISLYYSATASATPTAGNLVAGELALNTNDGKLYYKDSSGVVQTLASKAGNVNVSSFTAGTTGLTPNTASTGAVTLAGTLNVANGGTGLTTLTSGYIPYGNGTSAFSSSSGLTYNGSTFSVTGAISASSQVSGTSGSFSAATGSLSLTNASYGNIVSTNTLYIDTSSGAINIRPAASTIATFTTTGLGIGTSSPSATLQVTNASASGTGIVNTLRLQHLGTSADDGAKILFTAGTSTDGAGIGSGGKALNSANLLFYTGGNNERMRIDQDGNLLLGTTSGLNSGSIVLVKNGTTSNGMVFKDTNSTGGNQLYFNNSAGTNVGSINTSATVTTYNVTSDYRLKTVVGFVQNSGQRIDALEPIEFDWNTGGRTRGFLAHKFAEVYPSSVSGEKDAMDENGNPVYQAMQASTPEVIADLIAEIQSLRKRIATLENK
jgi:hypothetical protein